MQDTKGIVGFYKILDQVSQQAQSQYAKKQILKGDLSPYLEVAQTKQAETAEAKALLDGQLSVPFMGLQHIEGLTQKVEKGLILEAGELIEYADFLRSSRLIRQFFQKNAFIAPILAGYTEILGDFSQVEQEIYQAIHQSRVHDQASRNLRKIRKKITQNKASIQKKLEKFINHSSHKDKIQEAVVIEKDGRFTVPVKSSFKRLVPGQLIAESSKGLTAYIEPHSVSKLAEERVMLQAEESSEVYQILAYLTGLIQAQMDGIRSSMECIIELEVVLARAKYSRSINGRPVPLNKAEYINLVEARTPLIENPVPLSLTLDGRESRGLVITGANAGGKTVVLKTVTLMTYMAMSGLLVPCEEGTELAIFEEIFVEIGDNQSIERSLSTFSSHIQALAMIGKKLKRHTLVLLDEIGSGTEPREGSALAIASLNDFYRKGALLMVTTHYGEVKTFAKNHPQFTTAAMDFDIEKLVPTYQVIMHETGDSQAFTIASKMELPQTILDTAKAILEDNQLPLDVKTFDPIPIQKPEESAMDTKINFSKGDRVYASEFKQEALFYELNASGDQAKIYIDGAWKQTPLQRLKLLISAEDLYPANYDLDRLFMDYDQYKYYHDLYRGSKKAWKKK